MRYAYFFEFEGMEIHLGVERLRKLYITMHANNPLIDLLQPSLKNSRSCALLSV